MYCIDSIFIDTPPYWILYTHYIPENDTINELISYMIMFCTANILKLRLNKINPSDPEYQRIKSQFDQIVQNIQTSML